MSTAEAAARGLAAAGVRVAFCFPGGGSNLSLVDALGAAGVRVALARSETGGGLAAAALGEATRVPGVIVTGIGPGVASVVNAVAHAYLDRAPLLVVTDRYSAAEEAASEHQALDHAALLEPVTKWRAALEPATAAATVARAVQVALEHPRGPVHLELARDADRPAGPAPQPPPPPALPLARARRPALLLGLEALELRQETVVGLAERLRAPVLCTFKAKGLFPETHPLFGGILSGAEIERAVLDRADALLAVGLDPVELLPRPWPWSAPLESLRASARGDDRLRASAAAAGDLASLVARVEGGASEWTEDEVRALLRAQVDALRVPAAGSLASWQVVEAVAAGAPAAASVAVDAGAHMFAAAWFWRSTLPRRFLISNGLATMGYAVPAALAAALARPHEPAIAFTGDGGLALHGSELETAARLGARLLVVVLNDASLSLIRIKQAERGLGRAAVDYGPVDFAGLARALGARGVRAGTEEELRAAVGEGLAAAGPALVEVATSGSEYRELVRRVRG